MADWRPGSCVRRRGPPPAHVQGGGRARGQLLRAGRDADAQAAQPRGPHPGDRDSASWRASGRRSGRRCCANALREYLGSLTPARLLIAARTSCDGACSDWPARSRPPTTTTSCSSRCSRAACSFLADLVRAPPGGPAGRLPRHLRVRARDRSGAVGEGSRSRRVGRDVVLVEDIVDTGADPHLSAPRAPTVGRRARSRCAPCSTSPSGASCRPRVRFTGFERPRRVRARLRARLRGPVPQPRAGRGRRSRCAPRPIPTPMSGASWFGCAGKRSRRVVEMELVGVRVELAHRTTRSCCCGRRR